MNEELKDEERTKTEVFTRVSGYLRPISQFNKGKQAEAHDRLNYDIKLDRIEKDLT
jgi:anaerobic ribonucleoside-triphosphate reductase